MRPNRDSNATAIRSDPLSWMATGIWSVKITVPDPSVAVPAFWRMILPTVVQVAPRSVERSSDVPELPVVVFASVK